MIIVNINPVTKPVPITFYTECAVCGDDVHVTHTNALEGPVLIFHPCPCKGVTPESDEQIRADYEQAARPGRFE